MPNNLSEFFKCAQEQLIKNYIIINLEPMNSDSSLKRNMFAQSIRMQQRERKKKQIRDKFNQMIMKDIQLSHYNDNQFQKYKQECRTSNYRIQSIEEALNYLFSKDVAQALASNYNLKFINEVTQKIQRKFNINQKQFLLKHIKDKLFQLIQLQIQKSPKDKHGNLCQTRQFADLFVINNCFDELLQLVQKNKCYHQLWIGFSQLKNKQLKVYGFQNFQRYIVDNIKDLSSQQITVIANSIYSFSEDCPELTNQIIGVINLIMQQYHLNSFDAIKLIQPLLEILSDPNANHLRSKVEIIAEETHLIESITSYLDKSSHQKYKNSFQLTGKVGDFVAKMYSVQDQQLCRKVYIKNILILNLIRSWLPVQPNVTIPMLQHLGNGTLLHNNYKCTSYLIFALTNIVVTDYEFLEIMLVKTDIYRSLIYMYKLVPTTCRQQITVFLYNMTIKCDNGSLRIMLETKLPQILIEMLKDDNSFIIKKALGIIIIICKSLEEDTDRYQGQWLYTRGRFKKVLEGLGAFKYIDSLINSPEPQIGSKAQAALQLLN